MTFLSILLLLLAASTASNASVVGPSLEQALVELSKENVHLFPTLWTCTDLTKVFAHSQHLTLLVPDDHAVVSSSDFLSELTKAKMVKLLKFHAIPLYLKNLRYSSQELLPTLAGHPVNVSSIVRDAEVVYRDWPLAVYKINKLLLHPPAPLAAPPPAPAAPVPSAASTPKPIPAVPSPTPGPAPAVHAKTPVPSPAPAVHATATVPTPSSAPTPGPASSVPSPTPQSSPLTVPLPEAVPVPVPALAIPSPIPATPAQAPAPSGTTKTVLAPLGVALVVLFTTL